jgi:GMP synthase (glutamine-hydrolysing)
MAGRILVLQHAPHSSLGTYGEVLDERGEETVWIRCHERDAIPSTPHGFDAVISLGSETSVYHGGARWLQAELRLLRSAVESNVPVWGICYGAQLLAAALGARVWPGHEPEVGILPLRIAPSGTADPVFGVLPAVVPVLHWHGDSFDLPAGAALLASSDVYRHQAFRAGELAYGVQFHAESTADLLRGWIEHPLTRAQLEAAGGPGAAGRLLADAERLLPEVNDTGRALMRAWREAAAA